MATNASAAITVMYLGTRTSPYVLSSGNVWAVPINLPPGSILSVECWGGGSGGSGRVGAAFGSGGAGGAWTNSPNYVVSPNDYTAGIPYVIATGSAGTSGADSAAGGNTSFSNNNLNVLINTINSGAVVGTPGTLPFNWNWTALGGLSTQVVGFGTTSTGYPYLDVRLFGTSTGANTQLYASTNNITISTWNFSHQIQMTAGSLNHITTCKYGVDTFSTGSVYLANPMSITYTLTSTMTSYSSSVALPASSVTAATLVEFDCVAGAVDITVRVVAWQFELGSSASPWKSTTCYLQATGGAATSGATGGLGTTTSTNGYSGYSDAGGNGAAYNVAGAGGGGAGGSVGVGGNGTTAGVGGAGNAGSGGAGGTVGTVSPAPAGNTHPTGGGGGGSLKTSAGTGGAGAYPGGGGGAAVVATGTGGAGAGGQIKITYNTPSNLIFAAPAASINIAPNIKVMNPLPVSATNNVEILSPVVTTVLNDSTSATVTLGGISSSVLVTQFDLMATGSSAGAFSPEFGSQFNANTGAFSSQFGSQFGSPQGLSFFVIASNILAVQSFTSSSITSLCILSSVSTLGQSNSITCVTTLYGIQCVSALQIPYPVSGQANFEAISAIATGSSQVSIIASPSVEVISISALLSSNTNANSLSTFNNVSNTCSVAQFTQSSAFGNFGALTSVVSVSSYTTSNAVNSFGVLIPIGIVNQYDIANSSVIIEPINATSLLTSNTNSSAVNSILLSGISSIEQFDNAAFLSSIELLNANSSLTSLTMANGTVTLAVMALVVNLSSYTNASAIAQSFGINGNALAIASTNSSGGNLIEALLANASLTSSTMSTAANTCQAINCSVDLKVPLGATDLTSFFVINSFGIAGAGLVAFCHNTSLMVTQGVGIASQVVSSNSINSFAWSVTASMINPPPFSAIATIISLASATLSSYSNIHALTTVAAVSSATLANQSNTNSLLHDIEVLTASGLMNSFTNVNAKANVDIVSYINTLSSTNASATNTIISLNGSPGLASFTNVSGSVALNYNVLGQFGQNCFVSGQTAIFAFNISSSTSSYTLSSGSGQLAAIGGLGVFQLWDLISSAAQTFNIIALGQGNQFSNSSGVSSLLPLVVTGSTGANSVGYSFGALLDTTSIVAMGQNCPTSGAVPLLFQVTATAIQIAGGILVTTFEVLSAVGELSQNNLVSSVSLLSVCTAQATIIGENPINGIGQISVASDIRSYTPIAASTNFSIGLQIIGLGHNGYTAGHVVYWDIASSTYSDIIRTQVLA